MLTEPVVRSATVVETISEAERKAAARIGVSPGRMRSIGLRLWGVPLHEERDARLRAAEVEDHTVVLPTDSQVHGFGFALPGPTLQHEHRIGEGVRAGCSFVLARLGHASAAETLDTYSHLWPDSEDETRDAIDGALGTQLGHKRLRNDDNP